MIIFLGGSSPLVSKEGDIFDGGREKMGHGFFLGERVTYICLYFNAFEGSKTLDP